jgi:hypothetical protein
VKPGKSTALYSVPWRYIGKEVDVRQTTKTVEVFCDGTLIKPHARIERGKQTDHSDYPPEKIAFFVRTPAWCRQRAAELGQHVAHVVDALMELNALYRLRQAQGVIRLAEKCEPERLDAACRRALEAGDPTLETVRGSLAAGTEHDTPAVASAPPAAPAHLHGPQRLFGSRACR